MHKQNPKKNLFFFQPNELYLELADKIKKK